jgi:cytochrome c556
MTRHWTFAVVALSCLAVLGLRLAGSAAADKKEPTMKELMAKTHKGDNSPLMRIDRQLRSDDPAWTDVRKDVAALMIVSDRLAKGDGGGYRNPALYIKGMKALDAAAKKEDKPASATAFSQVKASCMSCHKKDME